MTKVRTETGAAWGLQPYACVKPIVELSYPPWRKTPSAHYSKPPGGPNHCKGEGSGMNAKPSPSPTLGYPRAISPGPLGRIWGNTQPFAYAPDNVATTCNQKPKVRYGRKGGMTRKSVGDKGKANIRTVTLNCKWYNAINGDVGREEDQKHITGYTNETKGRPCPRGGRR